jgi:hypothetical protein
MSNEEQFKKMMESYLAGDTDVTGVFVMVNEDAQGIDLLTLNTTNMEAFVLMLHGLSALHEAVASANNKSIH